jgi:Tetratricopeptide repeat
MANSARIDELRKKFDENPRRYFAPLANEYRKSGDLAQAVFILEEYLPQQPGHISGHIVYGQTLFELGRDEEAKRVFETALTLDPENLIALRHLGHISRQAGDFDAARLWYQRLLEADPRDVEIEQLLGSLDSAAQAQAASMAPPSAAPILPPPAPPSMADADDSRLHVEHVVEQDALGSAARASTHPLAPPPLPMTPEPPAGEEPPPLPPAVAEHAPVDPSEELFDLNDFSFDFPSSTPATPAETAPAPVAEQESPPSDEVTHEVAQDEPVLAIRDEGSWGEHFTSLDDPSAEPAAEMAAPISETVDELPPETADEPPPIPEDVPVTFAPFSGLESQVEVTASEEENVDGFEAHAFESPEGPVADQSEDAGTFYMMEPTYATPPEPVESVEPVEPAPGFESNEEEFVAEMNAEAPPAEMNAEATTPEPAPVEEPSVEERWVEEPSVEFVAVEPSPLPEPAEEPAVVAVHPVHPSTSPPEDTDAFATETMAQLYMSQGHLESALGIYRTLADRRPDDGSIRQHIQEIEDRVLRRRREPTPAVPTPAVATPVASAPIVDQAVASDASEIAETAETAETTESAAVAARAEGPTIRDFLVGILRRSGVSDFSSGSNGGGGGGHEGGDSGGEEQAGGTIDALFGASAALGDDLVAADTLSQAFSTEPATDPMSGNPTRAATNELSLDSVFGRPTAAHAAERSSGGFSFDEFFANDVGDESGASAEMPGDPEDIEQFNAWLNGLKKS